jgi:hypothetical protein
MIVPTTLLWLALLSAGPDADVPTVEEIKTPDGGVQPQAVVDASGTIHLVYLKGEPGNSDVYYATRKSGDREFGQSIRVNSEPGSAIATGTVRGARLAIGRGGRVHVAWNGSQKATPPNPINGSPMLYARSDEARSRFEPQRNLMTRTHGLDGGGSIAADAAGNVYVAWHGQAKGSVGEANRRVWLARSTDDGSTFSSEEPASPRPTGACGCCGTAALVDSKGSLHLLYRAATDAVDRDMILLTSRDLGRRFEGTSLAPWRLNACPMSTGSLSEGTTGVLAAWETKGQVSFARPDLETGERSSPTSPPGSDRTRKHPTVATNLRGETILAWTEGTGWQKGGGIAWQIFDATGRPLGTGGKPEGVVPVWGLAAVVARPDGGFTIIR